jgi:hypothetical protein
VSIVATEVESIHGSERRFVYYRCQDSLGAWHRYGPVITHDQAWDAEAFKATVAVKVGEQLAAAEAGEVIG